MNIPQEAVEAAAFALDGHSWMTDNEVSLCACGEVLKPSLEYAGDAYRSHLAELAIAAALPAIEKQIRAQVAADIWECWDACGDLIDDRDSARQSIDAIAAQIAKGAGE